MKSMEQIDKLIAEQSAEWTEVLKHGNAADMTAFAKWSLKSPEHMRQFLMMVALDQELTRFDPKRELEVPLAEDGAVVLPLHETSDNGALEKKFRRPTNRWAIAAAIIGIVAPLGLMQLASMHFGAREFSTARGEQRAVELADGSIMQLNTQSRAQVRLANDSRDIKLLSGEALFKVAKDAARPFRVHTSGIVIQAVGTQFNVYMQSDGAQVSVLEGRVQVSKDMGLRELSAQKPVSLSAGEELKTDDSGRIARRAAIDAAKMAPWRQRRLVFDQDPLSKVVAEFNRYNRKPQFRVLDETIGQLPYSGAFDADDPESLTKLLELDENLQLEKVGDEILIRKQ